jgi:hypothetical protein
MYRVRALWLSLLAVFAVGSVVSATASAALQGPWWKQEEGGKQIKLPQYKERQIKSKNEGAFILKGSVPGVGAVRIKCETVLNKGNIWNGVKQGADEATVEFLNCSFLEPTICAGTATVESVKVYTELMWKYRGETRELAEVGQQKIYDVFAPTEEPTGGKATFTKILGPAGTLCRGPNNVNAIGSVAKFTDQNKIVHIVQWGTAALVEPQNEDKQVGRLVWTDPNVTRLHHEEVPIEAKLEFATEPAELQGTVNVEENSGLPFGAFSF